MLGETSHSSKNSSNFWQLKFGKWLWETERLTAITTFLTNNSVCFHPSLWITVFLSLFLNGSTSESHDSAPSSCCTRPDMTENFTEHYTQTNNVENIMTRSGFLELHETEWAIKICVFVCVKGVWLKGILRKQLPEVHATSLSHRSCEEHECTFV